MTQRDAWEGIAEHWAKLVRAEGERSFSEEDAAFFELLPPPGRLALDLGCGEGRLVRELSRCGYAVVGVDTSPTLIDLARAADPSGNYRLADAAALPFAEGSFDLVVAFMSLQDMDDAGAAIREAGRVLPPDGRFCVAIIHPLWSAGELDEEGERLVIRGSYLATVPHTRPVMQVPSVHRPLGHYFRGLEDAGLLVEAVRELPVPHRLQGRLPVYLHLRAVKP